MTRTSVVLKRMTSMSPSAAVLTVRLWGDLFGKRREVEAGLRAILDPEALPAGCRGNCYHGLLMGCVAIIDAHQLIACRGCSRNGHIDLIEARKSRRKAGK